MNFKKLNSKKLFFILLSPLAIVFVFACAKTGTQSGPAGPNCLSNGATFVIASNGHTHPNGVILSADIAIAIQKVYSVGPGGVDGHVHTFTVAASNFTTLQGNVSIALTTDASGSLASHTVNINCN